MDSRNEIVSMVRKRLILLILFITCSCSYKLNLSIEDVDFKEGNIRVANIETGEIKTHKLSPDEKFIELNKGTYLIEVFLPAYEIFSQKLIIDQSKTLNLTLTKLVQKDRQAVPLLSKFLNNSKGAAYLELPR
jgi:hypothetical protein